jgi:hypothetical protein
MSLPESHTKETLSAAYVSAIVARAGQSLNITYQSDYGVDGIVHEIARDADSGSYDPTGHLFQFQLKATVNCELRNDTVIYRMEPKAYNKCVKWNAPLPIILIVFHLPNDETEWSNLTENRLQLKHCGYWRFMNVHEQVRSKKVVRIPRRHIFDENAVIDILSLAKRVVRENIDFDQL